MKKLLFILVVLMFIGCDKEEKEIGSDDYRSVSYALNTNEYEEIVSYILTKGDRLTYCSKYNNNPHFAFEEFDVYLNPEVGQRNINCDAELSGFNELVIQNFNASPQYFHLVIVRSGDLNDEQIENIAAGMKEGEVYLLNDEAHGLDEMEKAVISYLNTIKKEMIECGCNK